MPRRALLIGLGWAALLAGVAAWVGSATNFELRDQLRRWQFWVLEVQFVLLIALSVANVPACLRSLRLSRSDYVALTLAVTLVVVLAGFVAPLTNRIYYDEQIYQGIAQNLSDLRLAQMCNEGTVEYGQLQCWRGEYNKQPYGYPHLLSVVYRLVGVGYWTAPRLNVLGAAVIVAIVFLLAAMLFDDTRAARFSAVIAALIPQQLLWSHTAAAEPSAAMAGALAVLAAAYFVRVRTTIALAWAVVAAAYALQFRSESIAIVLVVVMTVALWAPSELRQSRLWGWALIGAALSTPLLVHLIAVRNEGWGAPGDKLSLQFLAGNLQANGRFYLADPRFPALYTALAFAALAVARTGRATLLLVTYFGLFFTVYLLFYAGSYNYGADVRFSLMTFPPLAVLAGAGASAVVRGVERMHVTRARAETLVAAILAFQFLGYLPLVRAVGEEAWAARADVSFTEQVADQLPANSIVLTHNPSVFLVMGKNAAQLSLLTTDAAYVREVLPMRYRGGVFVHWGFWCNVADPVQRDFCASALAGFRHTLAHEYRERDYRYAFYQLDSESPVR